MHVNTIVRWERGERVPTADKLKELADVLGTTADYLLDTTDDPSLQSEISHSDLPEERSITERNSRKLTYTFKNGEKLELPDTDKGYALFEKILMRKTVMA